MNNLEKFFEEVYFESTAISLFYESFKKRLLEQSSEEILHDFKKELEKANEGTDHGRKITRSGILMGEHEYKKNDFVISKQLGELQIICRLIDYNYSLINKKNKNAIQEDQLLWCITDYLCGRDAFKKRVLPEFAKRKNKGSIKTDLHSYVLNVCDELHYYNMDGNKAAGGYVSAEERDKKYKKIEKVYNILLRKRSKTNP